MQIGIATEITENETRVAIIPEVVKKLVKLGVDVVIESKAGNKANYLDTEYTEAGAKIVTDAYKKSDVIFKINAPTFDEIQKMEKKATLICDMQTFKNSETIANLAKMEIDTFAMEKMPRISRAQSMDILSSQSSLSGYRAIIEAAYQFSKAMPMMMTSAGSIAPARVLVVGAGVAGLQAIATAKRLGAVVYAFDVRAAAKEQVESLGGKFVVVDDTAMKAAETKGGYAKEMDNDYKKKQEIAMNEQVKMANIIVTTALIPGKPAPKLINKDMVSSMKKGSVIVDIAAINGGNCELTQNGKTITTENGVIIIGNSNLAGNVATDASAMFSRNLYNFISPFIKDGKLEIDFNDETVSKTNIVKEGKVLLEGV